MIRRVSVHQHAKFELRGPMYITVPKLIKIGQMVLEILHLTVFITEAIRHLGFRKIWSSEQTLRSRGWICVSIQYFVELAKQIWRYRDFLFLSWRPSAILDIHNFKFLVAAPLDWEGHYASSYQIHHNRSNGFGYIASNDFQNGGRPASWNSKNLNFWTDITVRRVNVRQRTKFRPN